MISMSSDECPCCLEDIEGGHDVITISCNHKFHKKCLDEWAETQNAPVLTCPCCRATLSDDFQWPKTFYTANNEWCNKWCISNRNDAIQLLDHLDKEAKGIAIEFLELQKNILRSIANKEPLRNVRKIPNPHPPDWFGPPYIVSMTVKIGELVFPIHCPVAFVGTIDLFLDFEDLKASIKLFL